LITVAAADYLNVMRNLSAGHDYLLIIEFVVVYINFDEEEMEESRNDK